MFKRFRALVSSMVSLALVVSSLPVAQAQTEPQCDRPRGITFFHFNGILTEWDDANVALQILSRGYGSTDIEGNRIRYVLLYNKTEGLADFAETFDQRLNQQGMGLDNRFELYFEAQNGGGQWTEAIEGAIPSFSELLSEFTDFLQGEIDEGLSNLKNILGDPSTSETSALHRANLDFSRDRRDKILLFAHSQGNLFADSAYDYLNDFGYSASTRVVHVAPASAVLSDPSSYVLADQDLVINLLGALGTVAASNVMIPGYALRDPGLNGQTDVKGHGLLEIYLNRSLQTRPAVDTLVRGHLDAFAALITEELEKECSAPPPPPPSGSDFEGEYLVSYNFDAPDPSDPQSTLCIVPNPFGFNELTNDRQIWTAVETTFVDEETGDSETRLELFKSDFEFPFLDLGYEPETNSYFQELSGSVTGSNGRYGEDQTTIRLSSSGTLTGTVDWFYRDPANDYQCSGLGRLSGSKR